MMKRPWTTLSVCGTRNGRSGSSPGTGPKLQVSAPVSATRRSTSHSATAMPAPGSPAAKRPGSSSHSARSEEHTSELQSRENLVCRLLLEKKNNDMNECGHVRHAHHQRYNTILDNHSGQTPGYR